MGFWIPTVCIMAVVTAAIAAVTDYRTGHIPNWLTLPALALGVTVNTLAAHPHRDGAVQSLLGVVLCGLPLYILFRKQLPGRDGVQGVGGGGDVKLFAALGSFLGWYHGVEAAFYSMCAAGIFGMARLAWHGRLLRAMTNTMYIGINPVLPKRWRRDIDPSLLTRIRMGGAILAGTCIAALSALRGYG